MKLFSGHDGKHFELVECNQIPLFHGCETCSLLFNQLLFLGKTQALRDLSMMSCGPARCLLLVVLGTRVADGAWVAGESAALEASGMGGWTGPSNGTQSGNFLESFQTQGADKPHKLMEPSFVSEEISEKDAPSNCTEKEGYFKKLNGECATCEAGFFCPADTSLPVQCNEMLGDYCPGGKDAGSPEPCPVGFVCPGTARKVNCDYYTRSDVQKDASIGIYCPERTPVFPMFCPLGYYCPNPSTKELCANHQHAERTAWARTLEDRFGMNLWRRTRKPTKAPTREAFNWTEEWVKLRAEREREALGDNGASTGATIELTRLRTTTDAEGTKPPADWEVKEVAQLAELRRRVKAQRCAKVFKLAEQWRDEKEAEEKRAAIARKLAKFGFSVTTKPTQAAKLTPTAPIDPMSPIDPALSASQLIFAKLVETGLAATTKGSASGIDDEECAPVGGHCNREICEFSKQNGTTEKETSRYRIFSNYCCCGTSANTCETTKESMEYWPNDTDFGECKGPTQEPTKYPIRSPSKSPVTTSPSFAPTANPTYFVGKQFDIHNIYEAQTAIYCPTGSKELRYCASGFYCTGPANQTLCSAGSFCPKGSREVIFISRTNAYIFVEKSVFYFCRRRPPLSDTIMPCRTSCALLAITVQHPER